MSRSSIGLPALMFVYNATTPTIVNLKRLFVLRNIEIVGQLGAVLAATRLLDIVLPLAPMLAVIALLALINLLTWLRLHRPWPVADFEVFGQLLVDVAALAVLLYCSGGSTNPFVSLFLVPLTLAAAVLPGVYTWLMAGITLACYTLLLFYYQPLNDVTAVHGATAMQHDDSFGLHVQGMWFNFLVSAGLIAFFVVRMADSIRARDRKLAAAREETLRNERIIALGTLAAGAAHELGSPLSSMAVLTAELQQEHVDNPALTADLKLLRDQVDNCKRILTELLASAGQVRAEGGEGKALDAYLAELMQKWALLHPGVRSKIEWQGALPAPNIIAEQTLSQALLNLLNNAADVSPDGIEVIGQWDQSTLTLDIFDRGPGLTAEVQANAGQPFFTTKGPHHGIGIGLFLANATLDRFGGSVRLFNREGGGAATQIILPLERLRIGGAA